MAEYDSLSLEELQKSNNIAELLDNETLAHMAKSAVRGYELDEDSRAEWSHTIEQAMGIAKQVMEPKSFPWPGAANIKMPIITRACIDYASRTLPEIIQNEKIVKGSIIGKDPQGNKRRRADRVTTYMSYQLLQKSPDWEDGIDKLLQTLPVLGTVFKKTYYSEVERRCISELCVPEKICVNYAAQSLDSARRVTHILTLYTNDILERQRKGLYLDDIDLETLRPSDYASVEDEDYPIEVLEQHCWWDLDGDGYKEPYIVTLHKDSKRIFRILPRFKKINKVNNVVQSIEPIQYFTDYHFIRSPDGGFYSMGFGQFLLPLNTAINTLINQLIDAGTLSNTQGGFYSNRLRLKAGDLKAKMGVYQKIDAPSGESLDKQFFNLPFKEPSATLFQLLGLLMQTAQDLSSTTDVLLGKQPAQNVASTTISQLIDQGTKVYTAVNKRVYRSLKREYQKIYELNREHLTQKEYSAVLDDPEANVKQDFEIETMDILPIADPLLSSDQQRLIRANVIQQLATVDRRAADEMVLEAIQLDEEDKKRLLPDPDPNAPPPPEIQKALAEVQKLQAEVAKLSADATLSAEKNQLELQKIAKANEEADARIAESVARVWKMQQDALVNRAKMTTVVEKMQYEEEIKAADTARKIDSDKHGQAMKEVELAQKAAEIAKKDEKDAK